MADENDLLARVGGDEFVVLSVGPNADRLWELEERVRRALFAHGIAASVGAALRRHAGSIEATWQEADRRMYLTRRTRDGAAGRACVL